MQRREKQSRDTSQAPIPDATFYLTWSGAYRRNEKSELNRRDPNLSLRKSDYGHLYNVSVRFLYNYPRTSLHCRSTPIP